MRGGYNKSESDVLAEKEKENRGEFRTKEADEWRQMAIDSYFETADFSPNFPGRHVVSGV